MGYSSGTYSIASGNDARSSRIGDYALLNARLGLRLERYNADLSVWVRNAGDTRYFETLGGGQGRLMRKFGLSCDNVRAFEIVTASGKLLKASAQENPDLYWALRGGGGNCQFQKLFHLSLGSCFGIFASACLLQPEIENGMLRIAAPRT